MGRTMSHSGQWPTSATTSTIMAWLQPQAGERCIGTALHLPTNVMASSLKNCHWQHTKTAASAPLSCTRGCISPPFALSSSRFSDQCWKGNGWSSPLTLTRYSPRTGAALCPSRRLPVILSLCAWVSLLTVSLCRNAFRTWPSSLSWSSQSPSTSTSS